MLKSRAAFVVILAVQLACAFFFVWEIAVSVLGLTVQPVSWQFREFIEIGAAFGLVLGVVMGALSLRATRARADHVEGQLRIASGAFSDLMEERFSEWGLTPAECDVALFSIKGLSLQEIASLRKTSEGTVKAQTNAIYRKAGVNGRAQLLSLFVEDLMSDRLV